jgi:hypothetical protein
MAARRLIVDHPLCKLPGRIMPIQHQQQKAESIMANWGEFRFLPVKVASGANSKVWIARDETSGWYPAGS